jgi:hypothetical protein
MADKNKAEICFSLVEMQIDDMLKEIKGKYDAESLGLEERLQSLKAQCQAAERENMHAQRHNGAYYDDRQAKAARERGASLDSRLNIIREDLFQVKSKTPAELTNLLGGSLPSKSAGELGGITEGGVENEIKAIKNADSSLSFSEKAEMTSLLYSHRTERLAEQRESLFGSNGLLSTAQPQSDPNAPLTINNVSVTPIQTPDPQLNSQVTASGPTFNR